MAAAKLLGWESIDTVEVSGGELEARLAEIDENLCRAELTPTQEAEHLAERKRVWEAMREAKNQVGQVVPPEIGFKKPPPQEEGFAASTTAATGKSKRDVNRAIRRATEVCQAARDLPCVAMAAARTSRHRDVTQCAAKVIDVDHICRTFAGRERKRPPGEGGLIR